MPTSRLIAEETLAHLGITYTYYRFLLAVSLLIIQLLDLNFNGSELGNHYPNLYLAVCGIYFCSTAFAALLYFSLCHCSAPPINLPYLVS